MIPPVGPAEFDWSGNQSLMFGVMNVLLNVVTLAFLVIAVNSVIKNTRLSKEYLQLIKQYSSMIYQQAGNNETLLKQAETERKLTSALVAKKISDSVRAQFP